MTQSTARRRGHGEDAIYFDAAKSRYVGAVSLGFDPDGKRKRRKVTGNTKQEVSDKRKSAPGPCTRRPWRLSWGRSAPGRSGS
jgi:hypothetical protein